MRHSRWFDALAFQLPGVSHDAVTGVVGMPQAHLAKVLQGCGPAACSPSAACAAEAAQAAEAA
ncbi:hypothetical protein BH11PSE7_BH11PSE7_20640 [soil metagenome]